MVLIGAFFQGQSHNFMDISSLLAMALICVLHPEQLCLQVPLMAIIGVFLPGRPHLLAPLMTLDGRVLQHHGHSEPPGLRHFEHGPTKPLLFRSTGLTQLTLGLGRGNGLASGEGGPSVRMMAEAPGNFFLVGKFLSVFGGFSVGRWASRGR